MTEPTSPAEGLRFSDLVARYLDWLQVERNVSPNTIRGFGGDLRHLLRFLGEDPLATTVTLETLRAWLAAQVHLSAETRARRSVAVRTCFRWATDEGLVATNPARRVVVPKVDDRLPELPSAADLQAVLEAAGRVGRYPARDRAMCELLYATGLRASELVGLAVGDLDLVRRLVHVRKGKGGKGRVVPFSERARAALEAYLAAGRPPLRRLGGAESRSPDAPLFASERAARLTHSGLRDGLARIVKAAGVTGRVWLHGFRHAAATALLEGGADVRDVQEFLGHTDLNTTARYTHITQTRLRRVYDEAHSAATGDGPPPAGGSTPPPAAPQAPAARPDPDQAAAAIVALTARVAALEAEVRAVRDHGARQVRTGLLECERLIVARPGEAARFEVYYDPEGALRAVILDAEHHRRAGLLLTPDGEAVAGVTDATGRHWITLHGDSSGVGLGGRTREESPPEPPRRPPHVGGRSALRLVRPRR